MTCVIDELKEILKSRNKRKIDDIDVMIILEKLKNNKCAKNCLLREEEKKISKLKTNIK